MKITGINAEQSTDHSVALYTNPPLTGAVITQIQRLMQQPVRPALKGVGIGFASGGLILKTPSFSQEMAVAIEELITAAETAVRLAEEAAKQKVQASEIAKQDAMDAAAKAFNVPIK